jgi:hypothetical protein
MSLMVLVAAWLGGCAAGPDSAGFRGDVENYVRMQGNSDPAVLRDVTWPASRRTFGSIGGDKPAESRDVNGVLLAVEQVGARRWIIFLVGVVDRHLVQEIHVEALSVHGRDFTWHKSEKNEQALARYRDYYRQLWQQRGGRSAPPAQYTTFPKEDDTFVVRREGTTLRVTHPASAAQWDVSLPEPPALPRAALAQ